ncbi:MAG: hypothetical protein AB8B47_15875 [Roseobacter sp.]
MRPCAVVLGTMCGMRVRTIRLVTQSVELLNKGVPQGRPVVIAAQINLTNNNQRIFGEKVALRLPLLDQRNASELLGEVF